MRLGTVAFLLAPAFAVPGRAFAGGGALETAIEAYLSADLLVDQEARFKQIPFATAAREEKRAAARTLVERAGAGWISNNRLGIVLTALGEAGSEQVPLIVERLAGEPVDAGVERYAQLMGMLEALGPRAKTAVKAVEARLACSDPIAMKTLAAIDGANQKLSACLDRLLSSTDSQSLSLASGLLGALGHPPRHVERTLAIVQSPKLDVYTRGAFFPYLFGVGEKGLKEAAISDILALIFDPKHDFSCCVSAVELQRGLPSHVPKLKGEILSKSRRGSDGEKNIMAELMRYLAPSQDVIDRLFEMTEEKSAHAGRTAIESLLWLGKDEQLIAQLEARSDVYRNNAKAVVERWSPPPDRAMSKRPHARFEHALAQISFETRFEAMRLPAGWASSGCAVKTPVPARALCANELEGETFSRVLVTRDGSVVGFGKRLFKVTPELTVDGRFGCEANHALDGPSKLSSVHGIYEDHAGALLVHVTRLPTTAVPAHQAVIRLSNDGKADPTFKASSSFWFGPNAVLRPTAEGKVYVGGQPVGPGSPYLIRLEKDGAVDPLFASLKSTLSYHEGGALLGIAALPDGSVFVSGWLSSFSDRGKQRTWLVLSAHGEITKDQEWTDLHAYLQRGGAFPLVFPARDGAFFMLLENGLSRIALKAPNERSYPELIFKNEHAGDDSPSSMIAFVRESKSGDVLVGGDFTHFSAGETMVPASGLMRWRNGSHDAAFQKTVERLVGGGPTKFLDAGALDSGTTVVVYEQTRRVNIVELTATGRKQRSCW